MSGPFKLKYKNSEFPFKQKKKKKEQKTTRQKTIDNAIEEGYAPKPNTKLKLKQFKSAYFDEKFV